MGNLVLVHLFKSTNSKSKYAKNSGLNIVTEISEAQEFYKELLVHLKQIIVLTI